MRFRIKKDGNNSQLETKVFGYDLINDPRLNKGTSFTQEERDDFCLHGIVPPQKLELSDAVEKRFATLMEKPTDLEKHIFLRQLQDRNETLFYAILDKHIEETMPLVYTPVVGLACQKFSDIYRRARGVFVSYPNRDKIDMMLASPYFDNVEVIVVSDGERILGLGDQGIGGMGIPIGKLSLYTACAGIAPEKTLPILLDVGTDSELLLNDPRYLGWKNKRIRGDEYDKFIDMFISAVKRRFPNVLLQFEDFARSNALKLLNCYKDQLCCFNDDIQGTAAVAVGGIISAINISKVALKDHKVVVVGAGSAGVGISNLLVDYFESQGIARKIAYGQIYLVDQHGLITDNVESLDFQKPFVKSREQIKNFKVKDQNNISLLEAVSNAGATILLGVSGQGGIFTQPVITQMEINTKYPIIFPLSNPTSKAEAKPSDIIEWIGTNAIIGTGSPFPLIEKNGHMCRIDQVNNCYIFPGVGLGILAVKAKRVTPKMFLLAAVALAELSPALKDANANLLPSLSDIVEVSKHVAFFVAQEAIKSGLSPFADYNDQQIKDAINDYMWEPKYLPYKRVYK